MPSLLSFHVQDPAQASAGSWLNNHIRHSGVRFWKCMEPDHFGGADPLPGIACIGRLWFPPDEPDKRLIRQGAAGARQYVEMCKPRWDRARWVWVWEGPNEPHTGDPLNDNDLDPMRWLAEFTAEFVRLGTANGVRVSVGQFSTGTPAGRPSDPVPGINRRWETFAPAVRGAAILNVHEYGMTTMNPTPVNEWHIHHYKRGVAVLRRLSVPVPPIYVTEFGIDLGGGQDTDGWRVRLNGNEQEYLRQLAVREQEYERDGLVWGITPFTWAPHGWASFDHPESVSWRIAEHIRGQGGGVGLPPVAVTPSTPPVFPSQPALSVEWLAAARQRKIPVNPVAALNRAIVAARQTRGSAEWQEGEAAFQWGFDEARQMWHLWRWTAQTGARTVHSEAVRR